MAALVDDIVVGGEDPIAEPVVAHELLDVLHVIEFGDAGWQREQGDVVWHDDIVGAVPARAIQDQHGVGLARRSG